MSLKRVLALVLALTMIFSLAMPGTWAFAEDDGIIAVEDEYNDEGIVEEPEEETPAVTEETPAEEPAEEIVVDEQPAEEPEEPAEEPEEESEALTLEDLETFEAVSDNDVARINDVNGYASIKDALPYSVFGNISVRVDTDEALEITANTSTDPIVIVGNGKTIKSLQVSGGTVTLNNVIIKETVNVTGGAVTLNNVQVASAVDVYGGSLTISGGEVKGAMTLSGGSASLSTTITEATIAIKVSGTGKLEITGGTYGVVSGDGNVTGNVKAGEFQRIDKKLLADGATTPNYATNATSSNCSGTVTVGEYAGMIYNTAGNRVYYATSEELVAAAVANVGAEGTIAYLLKDMDDYVAIPVEKQVKVSTKEAYNKTVMLKAEVETNDLIATADTTDEYTTYQCVASGTAVARNGYVSYLSLADAVAAAKPGDKIELRANITELAKLTGSDSEITLLINKNLTLDLAGFNIKTAGRIRLGSTTQKTPNNTEIAPQLIITGTGTIETTDAEIAPVELRTIAKGSLTIDKDVTLKGGTYGLNLFGTNDSTKNEFSVTIRGTIEGMVFVLGNLKNTNNTIAISVENGAVIDTKNCTAREEKVLTGIALNGYANLTVKAGAKISGETGIEVRAGSLTVEGGKIIGTAEYSAESNGNGPTVKGAGIAVSQHSTFLPITVNVSNGEISGDIAFATENLESSTSNTPSVQITNGNFTATGTKDAVKSNDARLNVNGFVQGGAFNTPVDPDYCVATYNPVITGYNADRTPIYGVTTDKYAFYLYATGTDISGNDYVQGYTADQAVDAVRDAINHPYVLKVKEGYATPTNIPLVKSEKIFYAESSKDQLNITVPDECEFSEKVESNGVKSVTAVEYAAVLVDTNGNVIKTADGKFETADGTASRTHTLNNAFVQLANSTDHILEVLKASDTDLAYTMINDAAKTLTVQYAYDIPQPTQSSAADTPTQKAFIKVSAPKYFQLHTEQIGNRIDYSVGEGVALVDLTSKGGKVEYYDTFKEAAQVAVANSATVQMRVDPSTLATATNVYKLEGTKTLTVALNNHGDVIDLIDGGTMAVVATEPTGNNQKVTYSLKPGVARIGDKYYATFKGAVEDAVNKPNTTLVLLLTPEDEKDIITVTAEMLAQPLTITIDDQRSDANKNIFDLIKKGSDDIYFTPATPGTGATPYTAKRYAAKLTDGTGKVDHFEVLANAIDEYYNPEHKDYYLYLELLDNVASYTMTKDAQPLAVKLNTYEMDPQPAEPEVFTIAHTDTYVGDGTATATNLVRTFTPSVYVAKIVWNEDQFVRTAVQNKGRWKMISSGTDYYETLDAAVASATSLDAKSKPANPEFDSIGTDYTIYILSNDAAHALATGTELTVNKNNFEPNITSADPEKFEVIPSNNGALTTYKSWQKYNISYLLGGGTNPDKAPAYYTLASDTVTLPEPTKDGYTFTSWRVGTTGPGYFITTVNKDNLELAVTGEKMPQDIVLTANWTANTYDVHFDANAEDATGTMEAQPMEYATSTNLNDNLFKRTGYTFDSWNTKADGSGTKYEDKASVTNLTTGTDVTLYSQWTANEFTVWFYPNNGTETAAKSQTFKYGVAQNLNDNTFTVPVGHTGFASWNTKADGTGTTYTAGADGSMISANAGANVPLYSMWTPDEYTVTFVSNGGTAVADLPVTYGQEATLPADPTMPGNVFQGWAWSETDSYRYNYGKLRVEDVNWLYENKLDKETKSVTLYAMWTPVVAQVGDVTYATFTDAVKDAQKNGGTVILWKTPDDKADKFELDTKDTPFVVTIDDKREGTNDIYALLGTTKNVYFVEAPVAGGTAVTYTLHRFAAKLTDGTGKTTYYKYLVDTGDEKGAIDEYWTNPTFYKYVEMLDNLSYTMAAERWAGKVLPVKVATGTSLTVKEKDSSYTIVEVAAADRKPINADADKVYQVKTNIVVVEYFKEKYLPTQVQFESKWVADPDLDAAEATYTKEYDTFEKAIQAIRDTRTDYVGTATDKQVRVTITLNESNSLALRANEEYTIKLGGDNVKVNATVPNGYELKTASENPTTITIKACKTNSISYEAYKWNPVTNKYDISFIMSPAELGENHPETFTVFRDSLTLVEPNVTGYTFVGWEWRCGDKSQVTNPEKPLTLTVDKLSDNTLTAAAFFRPTIVNVTFKDTDGTSGLTDKDGKALAPIQVDYNTTYATMTTLTTYGYHAPAKTGYTFKGWTINGEDVTAAYKFVDANVTLKAKWELDKHMVTFVNQTLGTDTDAIKYEVYSYEAYYGTSIIDLGDPMNPIDSAITPYSYPGYRFDKWYSDASMTTAFDFETTVGTENITIYGRFLKDSYFLTLDYNGGTDKGGYTTVDPIEFSMNSAANNLPVLTIADTEYEFEKWIATSDDGTEWDGGEIGAGFSWNPGSNPALYGHNWTLTAQWVGKPVDLVFIDGSKILYRVTAKAGDVVNNIANLKKEIATGTTLAKKIGEYPDGKTLVESRLWKDTTADTVVKTTDTAFHLNWLDLHEVRFFAKGVEIQTQDIADGELIKNFPFARIDGAEAFWHSGSVDGPLFTKDTPVTSDLELHATFAEKVKVTFKADGETVKIVEVVSGEPVAKIDDPEKNGYTFVGWFLDGAEEAFNFETAINEDTTLTAKFEATAELFKDVKFAATSTLSESINLNLYMWNLPKGTVIKDYTVKVKVADNPEVVNNFDASGNKYKTIAERAYAKQMNQKVQMTVYYKDLVIKEIKDYSLRQYFENRYAATTGNEQTMFKAALDYGAAAQTYFSYETDNLANSNVNPENTVNPPAAPKAKASREGVIDDIPNYGATLIMDSEITVRFKVNPTSVEGIDFEVDEGFKKSPVSGPDASGYYYVDVTGYSPLKLGNPVTLTITKGDELVEIQYSPYAYAASKWASTFRNGSEAKLVQAMYIFGEAVKAYFQPQQP